MESFFSRYKNALVLLLVLVLQLLALAVQAKRPSRDAADPEAVSLLRYTVVSVIALPERLLRNTGLWFHDVWFGYLDLVHVRRDNAALKDEIERLRLEQASVVEDARQGQRLQRLLGFKEHYIYHTVPAQVIGTAGTDQSGIVYIDKGSNDGLKQDMPVVTADGIVGRLRDVFPSTSQLMLISDPTSGVGVILETTRTRGILKGGIFGQVKVINISPDDRIKTGDKIITSGGDQIFPRGLPVGTVERVVPDPDRDPLLDVMVRPAANLSQLEEVLVISGMGDVASSQEAKDLAESEAEGEAAQKRASDVLSERLPSRLDPNAPADTNPGQNADNTGLITRPPQPPNPLRPDGFSPGMTPPAAELSPGQRIVPVKNGSEDLPPGRARAAAPAGGAAATAPSSGATASGAAIPHPSAPVAGVAKSTETPRSGAEGAAGGAPRVEGTTPAGAREAGTGPVVPRRPAAVVPNTSAPATEVAPLKPDVKTRVIVDGPEIRTPRPGTSAGEKPKPTSGTAGSATPGSAASGSAASGSAASPNTHPDTHPSKPATPVHRSPELVPDDGSRPPSETRPKKPAAPQPAAPQGRGV